MVALMAALMAVLCGIRFKLIGKNLLKGHAEEPCLKHQSRFAPPPDEAE